MTPPELPANPILQPKYGLRRRNRRYRTVLIPESKNIYKLTDLEIATMRFIAVGLKHKEIADEMGVSHHTINDRVMNVTRKLGSKHIGRVCMMLRDAGYFGDLDK